MANALDGLLNAHIAALKLQADDGVKKFAIGIANDILELAASTIETAGENATKIDLAGILRSYKN